MSVITEKYEYHNIEIPGGGYVTGFVYNRKVPNILYCRTDIGGVYRYSFEEKKWISLIHHVTMFELSETYPSAIALDESRPNVLYIACGLNEERRDGMLCISEDYGETFRYETIPCTVHGNFNGRGCGFRLVVDPFDPNILYFASQRNGLLITKDRGKTWESIDICGERYLTFVWVSPVNGAIVVATAGVTTKRYDNIRGDSLFVSYDNAKTFTKLTQPKNHTVAGSLLPGYVGERYDYDGRYLYVTLSNTGKYCYVVDEGYSCDGGDLLAGRVIRYPIDADGILGHFEDITPLIPGETDRNADFDFGFGGISSCLTKPGRLLTSTLTRWDGDYVFLSEDYGKTWTPILHELDIGRMEFHTEYMKPEYNGGNNIIHWLSDIKFNPFNPEECLFNTGTGVFRGQKIGTSECFFEDFCTGIEETVHLNLYSPPSGSVHVIDLIGDLGGFAFEEFDAKKINTFADEQKARYITCLNADYSDYRPERVVVTARGNWTGVSKGGLIISEDQCKTFSHIAMPYGLSEDIDVLLRKIESPNINAGWVAMSSDSTNLVWGLSEGRDLNVDKVLVSHNLGETFQIAKVWNLNGEPVTNGRIKIFADRVTPNLFYGFGEHSQIYVSTDYGENFREYEPDEPLPVCEFGFVDVWNKCEVRGNSGVTGEFYIAMDTKGLWKMNYHEEEDSVTIRRITGENDFAYRVGLGIMEGKDRYIGEKKTIYICGVIDDEYGFYKSHDEGETWIRINDRAHSFGDIMSIDGDSKEPGRFYLATGSLGVLYGEPKRS